MALYRLKVFFDDLDTVYRVIEIRSVQSFEDLHKAILKSIDFNEGEFASFYIDYEGDDEEIEICLSDLQSESADHVLLMKELKIGEIITKNLAHINYIYDFTELWTFRIEVLERNGKEACDIKYPLVVESVGKAPRQCDSNLLLSTRLTNDESKLINQLRQRNKEMLLKRELEEELYGDEHFDEELDEEEEY
jgi:hypothetical protein